MWYSRSKGSFSIMNFAHRIRTHILTWRLRNMPGRFRYRKIHPQLSSTEADVVEQLRIDGIAISHITRLFPPSVFDELVRDAEVRKQTPEVQERLRSFANAPRDATDTTKSTFLLELWPKPHILDVRDPFIRLSLSAHVLSVVNAYLDTFGRFRDFQLQITLPIMSGESAYSSQRWHADPDDYRMVKMFLYLNDVGDNGGPFTYVKGSHGGGRWRHFFPYAPKLKSRHPDPAFIEEKIPREDIVTATGRSGTLIFCDTTGIHRGGYATAKERLMYTSVYTTPAGFLPTRFSIPEGFDPHLMETSASRAALGQYL